jgi:hypothetical protein
LAVSDKDFALLQAEVKCMRKKLNTAVTTAGGTATTLTSTGSSVYPNSYYDCDEACVQTVVSEPDPTTTNCGSDGSDDDYIPPGDIANSLAPEGEYKDPLNGGIFVFDRKLGVLFKEIYKTSWENRNVGLTDASLYHGMVDPWWFQKGSTLGKWATIWQVGEARVMRSEDGGTKSWLNVSPTPPTGVSLSDLTFTQIIADVYIKNRFYVLAMNGARDRVWIAKTTDDGQNWTWLELGGAKRKPLWMAMSGNNSIWITSYYDYTSGSLRLMRVNADSLSIGSELFLCDASEWDVDNKFEILMPCTQVDTDEVWLYGRATNPLGLGLSHILYSANGTDFTVKENTWGLDWCGSLTVSLKTSEGDRNYYAVRNTR